MALNEATYTDPLGMPEDERMNPAELRVVREYLGLTGDWLAAHLKVTGRTVRAWEQGKYPIPDGVRLEVEALEAFTAQAVTDYVEALAGVSEPGMLVYRTDEELHAERPDLPFPASWHRAVAARVAHEVPNLSIAYPDTAPR